MANYSTLKAAVADVVKTNGTQAITGANLQSVLLSIINSIGGGGYIFKGVATPSTSAGTPDENVFYIGGAGTYANFGTSITVPVGSICVFKYNGSWTKEMVSDGLYNDFGIKIGILNLVNLLDTGVTLEQGGIETTGGDSSTYNAIRTSVPVNTGAGFIVAVPNGYNITRVLYYSSYTDNDNFTLGEYVAAGTQLYEVKTTYPLVRFMFGADGGAEFTPATFLQNLFLTTPKIEELKNSVFGNLAFSNNGYINASTGAFVSTSFWRTTDFIPVNPSDTFTVYSVATGSVNAAFYDENKAFKSSIAGTAGTKTITAPSTARYMRCSSAFGMTRPNPSITPNVIVYERVVQALNKKIEFEDDEIKANNIDSFYPVPASTATITTALTNSFYSQQGTTITITAYQSLGSMVVENIEVGKKYFLKIGQEIPISSYNNYFIFAKSTTEAVVWQSQIANYVELYDNTEHIYIITIPEQCTRVYTAGYVNTFSTFYVKDFGTKPLRWLTLTSDNISTDLMNDLLDGIKASQIMLFDSIKKPFDFSGKKFVAFGDSITQGVCSPNLQPAGDNKYISLFCSHVGANLYNYAVSGSCIADDANEVDSIHTTITSYTGTADIIFVAGGINDWQTEVPFGEYNDTDTSTFYGALNSICSYLKTNYASAEVIFVTPIPTTSLTVFGSTHPDNLDLYRKAIQEKAAANGFSVVNGAGLGLPNTMSEFGNIMFAPTDRLHPTLAGHAMYFRSLCGKLL